MTWTSGFATLFALIAMNFILFAVSAHAGIYTWTDEQGILHITDDPSNIPEKHRAAPAQEETEPPIVAEWVLYGQNLPGLKTYFDKNSLVKSGHKVTVRTKMVNKPPSNTGFSDTSGGQIRIATIELSERVDCREQTWKVLDRWYFDPEGKELTKLRESDQIPEEEIMASQHPLSAELYRSLCAR
jgi:hypothetical protein